MINGVFFFFCFPFYICAMIHWLVAFSAASVSGRDLWLSLDYLLPPLSSQFFFPKLFLGFSVETFPKSGKISDQSVSELGECYFEQRMRSLSSLGICFSLVSGFLFMALVAELCYLLWWKKRASRGVEDSSRLLPKEQLLHLLCWRKQSSLASAALNPRVDAAAPRWEEGSIDDAHVKASSGGEETLEVELMRLHGLTGPPRLLFTIREETRDELVEAEGGRSRGKSLSDLFLSSDSPLFVTPVSSPPPPQLTSLDRYKHGGFNPLFESSKEEDFIRMWSSPPPKLKFLKDAEAKLQHQMAMEGARQEETAAASSAAVAGKSRDRGHSCSTQVIPLHSSPSSIKPPHDKSSS